MRAYRNVNLNLPGGMISLPVSIAKVVSTTSDSPKVVGPNGEKVSQVYVNEQGEQVDRDLTKRQFGDKVVDQESLKAINEACKIKNLDIIEISPQSSLPLSDDGDYFVYSHKKNGNTNAFGLFVKALAANDEAALVKWTPSSRQQLLALHVRKDGALVASVIPFRADVNEADEEVLAHVGVEPSEQELELANKLFATVRGTTAVHEAQDEALPLRAKLIESGETPVEVDEAPASNENDLLAALKASLGEAS